MPRHRHISELKNSHQEPNKTQTKTNGMRPESAPLHKNNTNLNYKNTFERSTGKKHPTNTAVQDPEVKENTRRSSLTGRLFSAFE